MTVSHLVCEVSERRPGFLGDGVKLVTPKLGNKILDKHPRIFAQRKTVVKPDFCTLPIPTRLPGLLNGDVNKHECRKQWLRAFQEKEGGVNAVAAKIGSSASYVSSILGPKAKRNIGDSVARRIERAYKLSTGAVDLPSEAAQKVVVAIEGLTDKQFQDVLDYIEFKKGTKN